MYKLIGTGRQDEGFRNQKKYFTVPRLWRVENVEKLSRVGGGGDE
jgi:hypothetical protein